MHIKFENNFIGYFKFYYRVVGFKLVINVLLNILISFLDGIGLAMFMPLLEAAGKDGAGASGKNMGKLQLFIDFLNKLGIDITVLNVLLILVCLFIFKGIIKFFQLNYQINIRFLFMRRLRYNLLDNLQNLSYKGFLTLEAGRIQSTLTGETSRVLTGMNAYFAAMQSTVMLLTYIWLAFLANFQFAILVAIGAIISNLLYMQIYKATKAISYQLSKNAVIFNRYLVQAVYNFKYLKSTNYFEGFGKKLRNIILESEKLSRKTGWYNSITSSVKEPMIMIIVVGVIIVQVYVFNSRIENILLSLLLFYRSLNFLIMIQNSWQTFINNIGGMNSVVTISKEMEAMQEVISPNKFTSFSKEILVKDVSFFYNADRPMVLNNINIVMPKNKTIALVGESGSGKTTIANMITGLIAPTEGQIVIDNKPLSEFDLRSYRYKIGYISQDPVIFNDDIYNNVSFWEPRTPESEARFWEVIELASLTDYIRKLPQQEKTHLGDNGLLISGGQKQRISIARELYKNAQILILDEATSALDSETEKVIQENIDKLHGTYTMIIIAHRLSTIKNADIIYVLENGNVSASGSFDEVLEKSERFKRMVELQKIS